MKQKKTNKPPRRWLIATGIIGIIIVALVFMRVAKQPDTQCTPRSINTPTPTRLITASDYFTLGNYDYDTGNCQKALADYTLAIQLQPLYPQAFNNRAYTYMRMQQYTKALADLNTAIALKPMYIQALMNRGDLYNFYGPIINKQLAIEDYQRVVQLGGIKGTSVCGHLLLARHNGWNPEAFFAIFTSLLIHPLHPEMAGC